MDPVIARAVTVLRTSVGIKSGLLSVFLGADVVSGALAFWLEAHQGTEKARQVAESICRSDDAWLDAYEWSTRPRVAQP